MKPVWLDFAQAWPLRVRVLRYLLAAGGLLLLGLALLQQNRLSHEQTALSWQLQDLQGASDSVQRNAMNSQADPLAAQAAADAAERAGEVLQRLDLPWNALFNTLEAALANDVVILAVAPNPQQNALVLKAIAADSAAALDFSDRLKAGRLLRDIHMVQEEPWDDNPRFPLQFSLNAHWDAGMAGPTQRNMGRNTDRSAAR